MVCPQRGERYPTKRLVDQEHSGWCHRKRMDSQGSGSHLAGRCMVRSGPGKRRRIRRLVSSGDGPGQPDPRGGMVGQNFRAGQRSQRLVCPQRGQRGCGWFVVGSWSGSLCVGWRMVGAYPGNSDGPRCLVCPIAGVVCSCRRLVCPQLSIGNPGERMVCPQSGGSNSIERLVCP